MTITESLGRRLLARRSHVPARPLGWTGCAGDFDDRQGEALVAGGFVPAPSIITFRDRITHEGGIDVPVPLPTTLASPTPTGWSDDPAHRRGPAERGSMRRGTRTCRERRTITSSSCCRRSGSASRCSLTTPPGPRPWSTASSSRCSCWAGSRALIWSTSSPRRRNRRCGTTTSRCCPRPRVPRPESGSPSSASTTGVRSASRPSCSPARGAGGGTPALRGTASSSSRGTSRRRRWRLRRPSTSPSSAPFRTAGRWATRAPDGVSSRWRGCRLPRGSEDVHDLEAVCAAKAAIVAAEPDAVGVVVKHDNSGAGDGNVVVRFDGRRDPLEQVREVWAGLPAWYVDDLRAGGVVEQLHDAARYSSPSAQVDLRPDGGVTVLATHEQLVGGDNGQVFLGCRFPADPAYAARLGAYAASVGAVLAAEGCRGRVAVDFVATHAAADDDAGGWDVRALEVNLRKGGTTHPLLRPAQPGAGSVRRGRRPVAGRRGRVAAVLRRDRQPGFPSLAWHLGRRGTGRDAGRRPPFRRGSGVRRRVPHAVGAGRRRAVRPHRDRARPGRGGPAGRRDPPAFMDGVADGAEPSGLAEVVT